MVALTFLFTSCPFPDYCPRLTGNFEKAEKKINRDDERAEQLASCSPFRLTPRPIPRAHLKSYANMVHYDPNHLLSFLDGRGIANRRPGGSARRELLAGGNEHWA